jgi:glycosyltransferase involved in cell wall biosynthesis
MSAARIVAICLVRNEEFYLGQMLANIYDVCDEILIADSGSADSTYQIAQQWAEKRGKISCQRIRHPRESHKMIERYVNTPTWIFGVDGDELYDASGLLMFRDEVMAGKYDSFWQVMGNVLNCVRIDKESNTAEGYLSPPCRSMTKFFNFNAITEWSRANGERLHGGHLVFKDGFEDSKRCHLNEKQTWDESVFRCLHLCFMPRSSVDKIGPDGSVTRWNLAEQQSNGLLVRLYSSIMGKLGIYRTSNWKNDRYKRGDLVSRPVTRFFEKLSLP